ncbi:ASCH domain-containing protein [Nocardiopsis coralliicola]
MGIYKRYFDLIASGEKTTEIRVNDSSRKRLKEVIFSDSAAATRRCSRGSPAIGISTRCSTTSRFRRSTRRHRVGISSATSGRSTCPNVKLWVLSPLGSSGSTVVRIADAARDNRRHP